MTTTTSPAPAGAPSAPGRTWWRRRRGALLVVAGLVAATAVVLTGGNDERYTGALDPASSDPSGSRAVARVLEGQGIEVEVVRSAAAFADTETDAGTTVLVTSPENLGRTTAAALTEHAGKATVVLVNPRQGIPPLFDAESGVGYSGTREVRAECDGGRFEGLRLETREGTAFPSTAGSCFPTDDGALLTRPAPGLVFLGAADLLANEQVNEAQNAALVLRLLGQRDRLVWYVPDQADLSGEDGVSISSFLPAWLAPGLVLVGVAVVGLIAWRGRRLGPLAVEPLPVAVTAIETTRSRGRLYRKGNDRGYAAAALRTDARSRLAEHLLLPRQAAADVDGLVQALSGHTGTDPLQLQALLSPSAPPPATATDRDLITLAGDLAALIREVRRS